MFFQRLQSRLYFLEIKNSDHPFPQDTKIAYHLQRKAEEEGICIFSSGELGPLLHCLYESRNRSRVQRIIFCTGILQTRIILLDISDVIRSFPQLQISNGISPGSFSTSYLLTFMYGYLNDQFVQTQTSSRVRVGMTAGAARPAQEKELKKVI